MNTEGITLSALLPPAFRALCLSLGIFLIGCTGAHEAWREQNDNLSRIPQKVRLVCNDLPVDGREVKEQAVTSSAYEIHLGIGQAKDSRPDKDRIGRMFSFGPPGGFLTGRTDWSMDLVLETKEAPEHILLKDIVTILERSRFVVEYPADQQSDLPVLLDVELLYAKVQSYPAGWTELRGQIVAEVIFRAALVEGRTKKVLWRMDFPAQEIFKASYFLKRDHEEALSKAYCRTLGLFEKAVLSHDFRRAAQRSWGNLR